MVGTQRRNPRGGNPREEPKGRNPRDRNPRVEPKGGTQEGNPMEEPKGKEPKWGTQSPPKMSYFIAFSSAEERSLR